jgi:hypothetical protein
MARAHGPLLQCRARPMIASSMQMSRKRMAPLTPRRSLDERLRLENILIEFVDGARRLIEPVDFGGLSLSD